MTLQQSRLIYCDNMSGPGERFKKSNLPQPQGAKLSHTQDSMLQPL